LVDLRQSSCFAMSLLETLEDDIADLLGSDNEDSPSKPASKGPTFRTKQNNAERVSKSEKKDRSR